MSLHTYIQKQQQNIQNSQFSRSVMPDSATPWTAAHQATLSITNSQNLLKRVHDQGSLRMKSAGGIDQYNVGTAFLAGTYSVKGNP